MTVAKKTSKRTTGAVNPEFGGDQFAIDPAEHLRLCHMMVNRMIRAHEDRDDLYGEMPYRAC